MILSLWMYTKYCIPIVLQITTWRRGFMEQIELVSLGVSHWLYVLTVVAIIISIVFRRDVIIPSIVGLFLVGFLDRKSTRLNSSHVASSYAVFWLKKKD